MTKLWATIARLLDATGDWVGFLGLRLLLGWEFFESGLEKYHGDNWFADIQDKFPTPFNLMPVNISWSMATWFELIGGVAHGRHHDHQFVPLLPAGGNASRHGLDAFHIRDRCAPEFLNQQGHSQASDGIVG